MSVKGFYTDKRGKTRPVTSRSRRRVVAEVPSSQLMKQPKVLFSVAEGVRSYDLEQRAVMKKSIKTAFGLLAKASPRLYESFADDFSEIRVISPETLSWMAGEPVTVSRRTVGFVIDSRPDSMYINGDIVLRRTPKEIASTLGHETIHKVAAFDNTMEEEAVAYKMQSEILRRLGERGDSNREIRDHIVRGYRIPSILLDR